MKMSLKLCGNSLAEIRSALLALSQDENWESNCCGTIEGVDFSYDFVMKDNVFSDDGDELVIDPHSQLPA